METLQVAHVATKDVNKLMNDLLSEKMAMHMQIRMVTDQIIRSDKSPDHYKDQYEHLSRAISRIEAEMEELVKTASGKHYVLVKPEVTKKKILEANRKALNKAFKFKTVEECQSMKRSQPFYMSKEDIVAEIEKDNDLKRRMPPKYKLLKKEEICKEIFKN